MRLIDGAGAWTPPAGADTTWVEHLRVPDLSVGTYRIPAGGVDGQRPHTEDEIYVVTEDLALLVVFGPAYGSRTPDRETSPAT